MRNCPSCQSDQIKKVALVHAEGIGVGAGIGIGTGGVGVGVGVSASALATKCAPPKKDKDAFMKQGGHVLLLVFFVPLLIATFAAPSFSEVALVWKAWAALGFVLMAWLNFKFDKKAELDFQQAKADYDKTYMCIRCGTFYKPFD